ncbi:unnamed protein product [Blepharisma stoltei]|uniref:Uncharacterized protein n=1 Tax=Blepharisma stoltei TaxID=1481888 RepID=A0AAU9IYM5_9CILI|nr:unnamed protein product [Blepharisma stoltei]
MVFDRFFKGKERINSAGKHFLGYQALAIIAVGLIAVRFITANRGHTINLLDNETDGEATRDKEELDVEYKKFQNKWKKNRKEIMAKMRNDRKEFEKNFNEDVSIEDVLNIGEKKFADIDKY